MHTFGNRKNPTLLLLHGIGTGHRLWLRQVERFQATHFVIAPDLPGLTAEAGHDVGIPAIAKNLTDHLVSEAFDDINVCGISAGASVALAMALCDRPRIARLVLSAPQVRAPRLMLSLQIAIMALMPEKAIIGVSQRMLSSDPEIAQAAAEDCRAMGKPGMLSALRALKALDLHQALPKINAPALILCGEKDPANLPAARLIARSLPRARLHVEPGAGHLWNVQLADRFNEVLAGALDSDPARATVGDHRTSAGFRSPAES
jgi:3-oxoadipate enol-lactonase